MSSRQRKQDWNLLVTSSADKWGHQILLITGENPTRRSYVIWSCLNHPDAGAYVLSKNNPDLKQLLMDNKIKETDLDQAIKIGNPGQKVYITRMDLYLNPSKKKLPRSFCCQAGMIQERIDNGFNVFLNLLAERGKHYNTTYTPLFDPKDYKGKHHKHSFKCEAHNTVLSYSMKDLNTITSCPCPQCRTDPNHKNVAVDIVKKRNAGRPGQVIRHAKRVKDKYNNTCALSNTKVDLHHHHLDGQDFYDVTANNWDVNGICLCGVVHRDYHNNFLIKYSYYILL